MAKRSNEITTSTVDVVWANLRRPDEFRGSKKHDISIVMNDDLKGKLSGLGFTDYCSSYVGKESGDLIIKVKTTDALVKRNLETYDKIVDSQGKVTDYIPQGGDKVRVKIWVRDFEGKASLFLNGIQVVEANGDTGGGWDVVDGGFTAVEDEASTDCGDCPAAGCDDCPKAEATPSEDLPF